VREREREREKEREREREKERERKRERERERGGREDAPGQRAGEAEGRRLACCPHTG
jgi:hypothetical protein